MNDVLIDDELLENLLDLPPDAFEIIEDKFTKTKYIRVKSAYAKKNVQESGFFLLNQKFISKI